MVQGVEQSDIFESRVFSLENFLKQISYKNNLVMRGVIGQGLVQCVGGCGIVESMSRLFFECSVFASVWYPVCRWLNVYMLLRDGCP